MHQIDGALLEHAGAHATLDVVTAPRLQHDAIDARAIEKMREKQSRRTGADDGDLRARVVHGAGARAATSSVAPLSSSTRAVTACGALAAANPKK